tara:strand:+ start:2565 stop:3758 length:1194 start_codon:yes stop_codon:yes gene_type:complete
MARYPLQRIGSQSKQLSMSEERKSLLKTLSAIRQVGTTSDSESYTSLDIEKIEEKKTKRLTGELDQLTKLIDAQTSVPGLIKSSQILNSLKENAYREGNPESILQAMVTEQQIIDSGVKLHEYQAKMDNIDSRYMGYEDSDGNYVKGWKDQKQQDIQDWTVDYIAGEKRYLNHAFTALYKDPIAEKKEYHKWVGRYTPSGSQGDLMLIGDMERRNQVLDAATEAMLNDGIIDEQEARLVYMGAVDKIKDLHTKNIQTSEARIKSLTSSINSIESYKKRLALAIVQGELRGDSLMPINMAMTVTEQDLYDKWNRDQDNPLYAGLFFQDYEKTKRAEWSNMTIDQVMESWTKEQDGLRGELSYELDRFYKWQGSEYQASETSSKLTRQEERDLDKIINP